MSDTSSRPHTCPDAPDNRKYALSHSKTVAHYNDTDDSHQSTSPKRHGVLAIASAITSNWKKHRSKSTVPPSQYDDQGICFSNAIFITFSNTYKDSTNHNPTMPPTTRSDKDRTTPRKEKRRGRVFSTNSTITNLSDKLHHTQKPPKIYHMHNNQHATFDYTTAPVPWTQYPGLAVQDATSTLLEESGSSNDLYNKTIVPTKTRKRVSLTNLRSIFANENDFSIDEQASSAHHTNTSPRKREDTTPESQLAQLSPLKRAFRRRSMADLKNAITGNGSNEILTLEDSSSLPQDKSTNSSKGSLRKVSSSSTKTRTSSGNYSAAQLSKKVDDLETQLETARRELADALENPHAQTIPDDIPPIPILSAETRTKLEADALARSG